MHESEAKILFKKLKIRSLLDLALIIPSSYDDSRLSLNIAPQQVQTFEARVLDQQIAGGRMQVRFLLTKFKRELIGHFFKATPYHQRTFVPGSLHVIKGRVSIFRGELQIAQPRSLKEYGFIIPRYKCSIKESQMRALVESYITRGKLLSEGLQEEEIDLLLRLHFPQRYLSNSMPIARIEGEYLDLMKRIEAYNHLRKLRSKRRDFGALKSLSNPIEPFLESLPFKLTSDQLKAIEEIRADLARKDKAARRMIIGDVGSGKTMVILAAAMIASSDRSVLMAPTSILAQQLFEEARKYLPQSLSVALLMQGRREGDYRSADLIIGTQALLYLDDLPKAALLMVDEQHRFGARQRALLESLLSRGERRPHFLQFSATPIPRTQAMMDSELVDMSLIAQTPFKREIESRVIGRSDFANLLCHIDSELELGHQVLIVYPLVEQSNQIPYQSIEEARGFWERRYEGVYVTHGKDKNKESIVLEFRKKGRILLSTTVIEVGISLPRLTTIVIVGAERLGLATLHQLRGRVGRNGLKSWCFLYTKLERSERLEKFCQIDSGFEIARLDLAYRDSGDIVDGTIQSGQKFRWLDLSKDEKIIEQAKRRLAS